MRFPDTETFLISCDSMPGLENSGVYLLYSPINDEIALVDNEAALKLIAACNGDDGGDEILDLYREFAVGEVKNIDTRDVYLSRRMSVIPNLICNFSCSYCYSAKGRDNVKLDMDTATAALDWFIDNQRIEGGELSLFISGGGEPLMTWPLTRRIIEYAKQRAGEQGFDIHVSIITNASLITPETAQILAENNCTVGVSFEVLEDLQNQQRRHYERVKQNLMVLNKAGVRVKINSTITPVSVHRMPEMVREIAREYPFAAQYTMEPVTGAELFDSADDLRKFYDNFYRQYIECRSLAADLSVPLRFTFDDSLRGIVTRHCPGKLCLVPSGHISVCHLVSSGKEKRFGECIYGQVNGGHVELDAEKFADLYNVNVNYYDECRDCFAKWSCGGECMTRRRTYPKDYMHEVCRFNRRFILQQLLDRVGETLAEEQNITLEQYLND